MDRRAEILQLYQDLSGDCSYRVERYGVLGPFGLEGDDGDEFLEAFAEKYNVDLSNFLGYFHYIEDEPPMGRRIVPMAENGRPIHYIPVTVEMLVAASERGSWEYNYPPHTIRNRWWLLYRDLGLVVLVGVVSWTLLFAIL